MKNAEFLHSLGCVRPSAMTDWTRTQTPEVRSFVWATEPVTCDLRAAKAIKLE
jgi:hypothetical protein